MVKDSWSSRHDGVQQTVIKRTKEVSEKKRRSLYSWIINKVVSSPKEVSEKKRLSLYSWIIKKEVSSPNTIKATFYYQRRYCQWLKYRFRIISFPIVCISISSSCWYFIGWRFWRIPPDYEETGSTSQESEEKKCCNCSQIY